MGRPIKTAKAHAVVTITNTTATTNVVTTSQNLNNLGIIAGMPIVLSGAIGGLSANTMYWILEVVSSNTFTVSATVLNANVNRTPVTLSTATGTVVATVAPVSAYFGNPSGSEWPTTNTNTYGVVGGDSTIIGNQIVGNAHLSRQGAGTIVTSTANAAVQGTGTAFVTTDAGSIVYTTTGSVLGTITSVTDSDTIVLTANASANYTGPYLLNKIEPSYIVRQKGKQKFLVKGLTTGTVSVVYTVNSTLTPQPVNTIVITSTSTSGTGSVQSLSNKNIELFTANSGPVATGNIVYSEASPAIATFNGQAVANVAAGIPYPIVNISSQ